ncbi:MAG: tripartite tricarboxylate transporter substrate binding protein [Burkholderiales bacterium]|nr:tripartite tricarboxylate transporter substrate binding protein [Burkholderiales bacterium]
MRTLVTGLLSGILAAAAHAQAPYPAKPLRMIVPLAAGSAVDVAARIVTARMGAAMGQSIVIENMPGAAGIIGAERVARAPADGYTLGGFNDSIMTMVPHVSANVPWNILKDFEPVSLVATVEWGMAVNPASPYRTAADLIAAAKAAPGKINYASGGNGSPQHIGMALFASLAGIQMTHVPYKGATQAATGVAGGEAPVTLQGLATVAPLVRGGKLRLVGVAMKTRHTQFADAPPIAESGLPGFEFNSWFAILAPAGTPKEIGARLAAEVSRALADPEVRDKLNAQGLTPRGTTPEELGSLTQAQLARYGRLIRDAGIKAE